MSKFSAFMKQNKKQRENVKYKATASLCDEKGVALDWELRPLETKETEAIRERCTKQVEVAGRKGQYTQKINTSKYVAEMIVASVVVPNLNDKELQDSYGVMSATELLYAMIDNPNEYSELGQKVQELSGFTPLEEKVEEAKN